MDIELFPPGDILLLSTKANLGGTSISSYNNKSSFSFVPTICFQTREGRLLLSTVT